MLLVRSAVEHFVIHLNPFLTICYDTFIQLIGFQNKIIFNVARIAAARVLHYFPYRCLFLLF